MGKAKGAYGMVTCRDWKSYRLYLEATTDYAPSVIDEIILDGMQRELEEVQKEIA